MREPSEDAVLKRAKELWKEAGYTDGAEARSVSCLGTRLPRARVLMTPTRLQEFIQQARNELRKKGSAVPQGRRGEKRTADVVGISVKVMRLVTGEEEGSWITSGALPPSWAPGAGGCAPKNLSPKPRSDIARTAAVAR